MTNPHPPATNAIDPTDVAPPAASPRLRNGRAIIIAIWGAIALAGVTKFSQYHLTPTAAAVVTADWPTASGLRPINEKWNAIMMVHPLCPCTPASLEEFAKLGERWPNKLVLTVVFSQPEDLEAEAGSGKLWSMARRMRNARVVSDADGMIARSFDAQSSGQTFLYDPEGRLRFSGGVTVSRGQAGDNAGTAAIHAALSARAAPSAPAGPAASSPVFGCSLE